MVTYKYNKPEKRKFATNKKRGRKAQRPAFGSALDRSNASVVLQTDAETDEDQQLILDIYIPLDAPLEVKSKMLPYKLLYKHKLKLQKNVVDQIKMLLYKLKLLKFRK
jgi:hypothetical protein